jgi:hypothetical protein
VTHDFEPGIRRTSLRYLLAAVCGALLPSSLATGQSIPPPSASRAPAAPGPGERSEPTEELEAAEAIDELEREEIEEFIETDRNSFTFSRLTAGAGRLITESSYSFIDLHGEKIKNSFPELLFRYGIGDRFELRLGWNYETGRERRPDAGAIAGFFGANAEQQIFYGFKTVVTKESGWIPGSAFLAQGHTPTGGPETATQLRLGYVLGWRLPNRWDFDAAFRFGTDEAEGNHYTLWVPSVVLKIPLTSNERLFTHIEYFGVMTNGKREDTSLQFVDTALHYLITPNIEVGGIVAFGPLKHGLDIVTNVGIGVRF